MRYKPLKNLFRANAPSQGHIAVALGVSEPTVSRWASGEVPVPSLVAMRLAEFLKVPLPSVMPVIEPDAERGAEPTP